MTTTIELVIGLFAVASGTWSIWDTWREHRKREFNRQRWEALSTELDRYREYFQGDFPRNVTVRDGALPERQFEIRSIEPTSAQSGRSIRL